MALGPAYFFGVLAIAACGYIGYVALSEAKEGDKANKTTNAVGGKHKNY